MTDPEGTTISVGTGDGQDVRKTIRIAIITLGVIGGLLLCAIVFWCVRKRNSRKKHPQIDEASLNADAIKYLIPDLLPVAPTGLYSVISKYDSQRHDELNLQVDQVIAIKEAYSDKWAKGTNITTGKQGFFPLAVLISDEKYLKKGIQISKRVKSLKASSKFNDRLF